MGLSHSPGIIPDGLVFYFDPINPRSYAGTGLTGYNLIDTTMVGSFNNGASYDLANKGSIYFDAVNDSLSFSNSSGLTFTTITVCAWFKKNQGSGFKALIDKGRDGFGAWCLCIDETANRTTFKVRIAGANQSITTTSNYNSNAWTYVCGVYDGSNLLIYQNGVLNNSAAYSGSIGSNAIAIRIGAANDGYSFDGLVASAAIYNRALSSTEILQNYNATKKRFSPEENIVKDGLVLNFDAGNPNSYVGTGITAFSTAGVGYTAILNGPTFTSTNGGGFVFDNTFKYISLPSIIDSNNDLTVSFWNRRLSTGSINNLLHGINLTNIFQIRYDSTNLVQLVKGQIVGMGSFTGYTSTANNDLYLTVRFTKSSSTYDLFINGAYISSITNAQTFSTSGPILGSGFNGSEHFNGYIYSFTYYNRVLTSTEVLQNYNALKGRYGLS